MRLIVDQLPRGSNGVRSGPPGTASDKQAFHLYVWNELTHMVLHSGPITGHRDWPLVTKGTHSCEGQPFLSLQRPAVMEPYAMLAEPCDPRLLLSSGMPLYCSWS